MQTAIGRLVEGLLEEINPDSRDGLEMATRIGELLTEIAPKLSKNDFTSLKRAVDDYDQHLKVEGGAYHGGIIGKLDVAISAIKKVTTMPSAAGEHAPNCHTDPVALALTAKLVAVEAPHA